MASNESNNEQGNQPKSKPSRVPLFIGIVIGLAIAILAISGLNIAPKRVKRLWILNGNSTPDPPVVMRGGSVTAVANLRWVQVLSPNVYKTPAISGTANTVLLDGVELEGGTDPSPQDKTFTAGTNNWSIDVKFRNIDSGGGPTHVLICSNLNNNKSGCDTGSSLSTTGTVFLVWDPNDTLFSSQVDNQNARIHAELSHCDYSNFDAGCDHIQDITLSGFTTGNAKYRCEDGACFVGISSQ
jgi:hypothetical protein